MASNILVLCVSCDSDTNLEAAGDVSLLEAARAHVCLALVAIDDDSYTLDIGTELAVHRAERVCNGTTSNGMLTAELTNLGHNSNLHQQHLATKDPVPKLTKRWYYTKNHAGTQHLSDSSQSYS